MLTSALVYALQAMLVPGLSLLTSSIVSKILQDRGLNILAATVTTGTVSVLVMFWLLPMIDCLTGTSLSLGSYSLSGSGLPSTHVAPSTIHLNSGFDLTSLHSEVSRWGHDSLSSGMQLADTVRASTHNYGTGLLSGLGESIKNGVHHFIERGLVK